MDLPPLCGLPDDYPGLIPPGPSYMSPDPSRAGEGRSFATEATLCVLSGAAAGAHAAQLQLDDLSEMLDGAGADVELAVRHARDACTSARRSLRVALLGIAGVRHRLVVSRGGPPPPRDMRSPR